MSRADRAPRIALRDWARPPYDVVWFSTARSYEWTGRPDLGPTIVDLDNLEDVKAGLRAELLEEQLRSADTRSFLTGPLGPLPGSGSTAETGTGSSGRWRNGWSGL